MVIDNVAYDQPRAYQVWLAIFDETAMTRVAAAFSLPWTAFVGAFLYYTLLTLVAVAAQDLPAAFIGAYGVPVVLYACVIAIRALAKLRVDFGLLPYSSLR